MEEEAETTKRIRFLYNGEYYTGDIELRTTEPTMISEPQLETTTDIITGLEGSIIIEEDVAVGNEMRCKKLFVNNTEIKAEIQGQVDFLYKYLFNIVNK